MIALILLILLVLVIYYAYYRNRFNSGAGGFIDSSSQAELTAELNQIKQTNQTLITFLKTQLNSNSLDELKTKLNGKSLNELLEENSDWETEVDTLTRTKNSLEQDLLAQSNAFQNRLREKDREVKKAKEDLTNLEKRHQKQGESLTSEKQQHKGSIERINLLTQQIQELTKQHQNQLKAINLLFDPQAKDYTEIDFNGLYALLERMAKELKKE